MTVHKNNIINILAWIFNLTLIGVCLAPIGEHVPKPFERSDLLYHAASYSLGTGLFLASQKYCPFKVMIALITQGIAIEFIQPYFGRFFEYFDIGANVLGVLLAFTVYKFVMKPSPR